MIVQVVNIGDGACTVVRSCGETMVIDCGALADSGHRSANRLAGVLGSDPENLSTVVVSHFDSDHWTGLEKLPGLLRGSPSPLRLLYPRHPAAAAGLQQMLAATLVTKNASPHGNALKLDEAWRPLFPATTRHALVRGDQFEAVGRTWTVHWPPEAVDMAWSRKFAAVAARVDRLAHVYPQFKDALEEAFSTPLPTFEPLTGNKSDNDVAISPISELDDVDLEQEPPWADGSWETNLPVAGSELELDEVYRQLQELNNSLSLVLSDDDQRVVAFGDIERWGLRRLTLEGGLPRFVRLALAPHHGTQLPTRKVLWQFPISNVLVTQRGPRHEKKAAANGADQLWSERARYLHSTHWQGDYVAHFQRLKR